MIIRSKTFKQWLLSYLNKDRLADLANYGAAGGFPGLTYYKDTCKLYSKFKDEIWEMLTEDAESFGNSNVFELIAGFGGAINVSNVITFENLMVWYAAERIAREVTDGQKSD